MIVPTKDTHLYKLTKILFEMALFLNHSTIKKFKIYPICSNLSNLIMAYTVYEKIRNVKTKKIKGSNVKTRRSRST